MIEYVGDMLSNPAGAVIRAIGIGGGGCNAIDNIKKEGVTSVDFIAANSDVQALNKNIAEIKIQVGKNTAKGLGVGGNPEIGKKCIEESAEDIKKHLIDSDMVFISAGMGGGTGTGGAPQVARIAKELEALVVAVVTTPFKYEGTQKGDYAVKGIEELKKNVDSVIVVSNQKLLEELDKSTPVTQAFKKVDEVLINASKGIVDIIQNPGLLNIDFADIRSILKDSGDAIIGIGSAKGENRATIATENALNSPLLDGVSIKGAKGILINITADDTFSMEEMETVTNIVNTASGANPYVKSGIVINSDATDDFKVTVLATKFEKSVENSNNLTNQEQIKNNSKQVDAPLQAENKNRFNRSYNRSGLNQTSSYNRLNNDSNNNQRRIDDLNQEPQANRRLNRDIKNSALKSGTYDSENSIFDDILEEAPRQVQERPVFLRRIMD